MVHLGSKLGLSRRRAAQCFGVSFFIASVSVWTLKVDVLLKEYWTKTRTYGDDSAVRKEAVPLGYTPGIFFEANAPHQVVDDVFTRIWNRKKNTHAQYVRERDAHHSKINFTTVNPKKAYDYFEPEWNCEDEVRLGQHVVSPGDGPKFVCGVSVLASTEGCIVYSIGSNYDFSFEYAVNKIAPQCEIHTFDGTLNLTKRALPEGLEGKNIQFHNWNIVSDCRSEELAKFNSPSLCVADSLRRLGHHESTITWLKIDCEHCVYTVMAEFVESSVRIDQIMIEIHGTNALKIKRLFSSLHNAGMMIFHKERNHWGCQGYKCVEYSLMTSDYAKSVLRAFLERGSMKDTK